MRTRLSVLQVVVCINCFHMKYQSPKHCLNALQVRYSWQVVIGSCTFFIAFEIGFHYCGDFHRYVLMIWWIFCILLFNLLNSISMVLLPNVCAHCFRLWNQKTSKVISWNGGTIRWLFVKIALLLKPQSFLFSNLMIVGAMLEEILWGIENFGYIDLLPLICI